MPRHEIASGGSAKIVPQESGAAGGLWGFWHVADTEDMRTRRVGRCFFAFARLKRPVQVRARLVARDDGDCSCLQIERMSATTSFCFIARIRSDRIFGNHRASMRRNPPCGLCCRTRIRCKPPRRVRELVRAGNLDFEFVPYSCSAGAEGTATCNYGSRCGTLTVSAVAVEGGVTSLNTAKLLGVSGMTGK